MALKIRNARKEDLDTYIKLKEKGLNYFMKISGEKRIFSRKKTKDEFEQTLVKRNNIVMFLEVNKEIIGFMLIDVRKNKYQNFSYLYDFYILKDFRGKKYGRSAMEYFIDFSKKRGVEKIGLGTRAENIVAINLYKKLGFEVIGYNFSKKLN